NVRGRCNTQTLPWASTFELDTMPRIHWLGTLGQVGSTLNLGTSRDVEDGACAAAVPKLRRLSTPATITAPNTTTIAAIVRFMGAPPGSGGVRHATRDPSRNRRRESVAPYPHSASPVKRPVWSAAIRVGKQSRDVGMSVPHRVVERGASVIVNGITIRPLLKQGGDQRSVAENGGCHQRRPTGSIPDIHIDTN